jgi:hypothetical protein
MHCLHMAAARHVVDWIGALCVTAGKTSLPLLVAYAGVELPSVDYDNLRNALIDNCVR